MTVRSRLHRTILPDSFINGLRLVWVSDSQIQINAGVCKDSADKTVIRNPAPLTVDLSASGANGLDVSVEAASTFYAVHVIKGMSGFIPTAGLFSLSETDPTLPENYTDFRHIGWVRNNASSNIRPFLMRGRSQDRLVQYLDPVNSRAVLSGGSATEDTSVDCSSLIPPNVPHSTMHFSNPGPVSVDIRRSIGGSLFLTIISGAAVVMDLPLINRAFTYDNNGLLGNFDAAVLGYRMEL